MGHEVNDARSLAYHRVIADRLAGDTSLIEDALDVVARWREQRTVAEYYADAWEQLLRGPMDRLAATLIASGEAASALRQVSPFTRALPPRERWAIWRSTRAQRPGHDSHPT